MKYKPYRRKVIGEIDGITVYGQYYDEDGKPIERNVSNPYSDQGDEDDNWSGNGKKLFY